MDSSEGERKKRIFGSRHLMTLLAFFGYFVSFGLRINITVAVVAMVNQTSISGSSPNSSNPDERQCYDPNSEDYDEDTEQTEGSFEWSMAKQGLILGSFYYGYCITQIPGGYLAERHGGKLPYGLGLGLASVFTLFNPLAAKTDVVLFIVLRGLQGLAEGLVVPALYVLVSKWIPEQEKSFLMTIMFSGSSLGLILTLPLSGFLAETWGWEYVFYVTGAFGCVWTVIFFCLASDTPRLHKRISKSELKYIEASINTTPTNFNTKPPFPPVKSIFKSVPFWALVVVHFGNNWGYHTLMSGTPLYLSNIQNYALEENGLLSALPYVVNLFVSLFVGILSDKSISSGKMGKTFSRKLFSAVGTYGSAVGLIWLAFVGCQRTMAIVALCLANGLNAFTFGGFMITFNDLSPNYAGTVSGIDRTIISIAGFLSPMVMGLITEDNQTIQGWRTVFLLGGSIFIFSNTIYMVFGSAEKQPWDEAKTRKAGDAKVEDSINATERA